MYEKTVHELHDKITSLLCDLGRVLTKAEKNKIVNEIMYPNLGLWNYKICLDKEALHKIISALQKIQEEVFGEQLPDIDIDKWSKLIQGE